MVDRRAVRKADLLGGHLDVRLVEMLATVLAVRMVAMMETQTVGLMAMWSVV